MKMLLATPYMPFDEVSKNNGPPRVISEIKKSSPINVPREQIRPRISGDLLVICANEQRWWPRRVMVRGGQLLIGSTPGEGVSGSFRIPLRHLSLAAGPLPNSLALYRGPNIVLTLQTASERAFDLWVKTIAIELIRQTPLDAVKYLDILTLADCWNRKNQKEDCEKDWNFNYVKENTHAKCSYCTSQENQIKPPPSPPPPLPIPIPQNDEKNVEVLLKRCQNSDNYVPVKDKLVLFESLCRLGRKVRSTEDVSLNKINVESTKRAVSMHDLSNCPGSTPGVRQICKYFENKTDQQESEKYATINRTHKRLINSDSQLNHVSKSLFRYNNNNYHNTTCA